MRIVGLLPLLAAVAAGVAPPVHAAPGWSMQVTPFLSEGGLFSGVSCTSTSACTAVGQTGTVNVESLAERFTATWSIQATPKGKALEGVSCTSTSACTAVGESSTGETLAEVWNGKSWAIQPTPAGGGALSSVSCRSSTACVAVGRAGSAAIAERWNGKAWSVQPVPTPAGTKSSFLSGVSCAAASACTAVGEFSTASANEGLAERWNGKAFSLQPVPTPAGEHGVLLRGVSCPAKAACTAVGRVINGAGTHQTLAERWNGRSWSIQSTPNPTGAKRSELAGVSCASKTACTAVGPFQNSESFEETLAEGWNGHSWSMQSTPPAGKEQTLALFGVSCTSSTACLAVGGFADEHGQVEPLVEQHE